MDANITRRNLDCSHDMKFKLFPIVVTIGDVTVGVVVMIPAGSVNPLADWSQVCDCDCVYYGNSMMIHDWHYGFDYNGEYRSRPIIRLVIH